MISQKFQDAVNEQINAEIYSAYLYMSMGTYFESLNLNGFANWMRVQTFEEMTHADKFHHHVVERGGRVLLKAIEGPATDWDSPLAAMQAVYEHEQKVTSLINALADVAEAEKDRAAYGMLQWFVDEQIEEEASADAIVQKLKLIGDHPQALLMLDSELGARVFTPPAAEAE